MDKNKKRSIKFLLSFASFSLGLNYLWISYNSLILPTQVMYIFPENQRSFFLGAIASGGVVLGITMNIFSGVISDQFRSKLGRRTPFIVLGITLLVPTMLMVAFLPLEAPLLIFGYVFMQIFSNLSQGSYQPLLPDLIEQKQRGEAGGFLGLFTLIGNAMGYGITGILVGMGYLSISALIIFIPLTITTFVLLNLIKKEDTPYFGRTKKVIEAFIDMFNPKEKAPGFIWLVLGSFFVMTGSTGLIYFELYFFQYVLKLQNPAFAVAITGVVVLIIGMVAAISLGYLSDIVGRKYILIIAALVGGVTMPFLPFTKSFTYFLILAAIVGATTGLFISVETAYAGDLVPKNASGQYMAYSNIAIGGSSAFAPIIDGLILTIYGLTTDLGFIAMFFTSSLFYFLGAILLLKTPKR